MLNLTTILDSCCRSREGAWIEIRAASLLISIVAVAPARERGLKYQRDVVMPAQAGRSREGAWIEMERQSVLQIMGVVAPARERGLKLCIILLVNMNIMVAPARERGLKYSYA